MSSAPEPQRRRRPPWRVLEHGTKIYSPTPSEPNVWRVVFYDETGRIFRTATSEEEAMTIARKAEAFLAARVSPRSGRTVSDGVKSYLPFLKKLGLAERYRDRQQSICDNWILPIIGDLPLTDWGPYDNENVLGQAREAGRKPATIQSIGATLRGLVSHVHLREWLPPTENPMNGVSYSIESTIEGESALFVPAEEIPSTGMVEALACALETMFEPYWGLACRLAKQGGARYGELIGFRPIDVTQPPGDRKVDVASSICEPGKGKPLYRKTTKSNRRRPTLYYASSADPLGARVAQVLDEQGPEGLLFPGPDGEFASRFWFRNERLLPAMRKADWEFVARRTPRHNWHSIRHLAATSMLNDLGLELKLVSYFMGHANPLTTAKMYLGHTKGAIDRAMDATEDV